MYHMMTTTMTTRVLSNFVPLQNYRFSDKCCQLNILLIIAILLKWFNLAFIDFHFPLYIVPLVYIERVYKCFTAENIMENTDCIAGTTSLYIPYQLLQKTDLKHLITLLIIHYSKLLVSCCNVGLL
jgi:hypothetical protein